MCRPFPSVFISSFSSSFCPCRPLCQVTRQLFPSSLVASIVGSGVRIQWSCRCPLPPLANIHSILSTLSLSLSFLPPSLLQGSRLLFARLGFLESSVLSTFLYPRTVFSLVLCHDAVFGWSHSPSSSSSFFFSIFGMQSRTVHSPASSLSCPPPQECPARRTEGLSTCLTLSWFSG